MARCGLQECSRGMDLEKIAEMPELCTVKPVEMKGESAAVEAEDMPHGLDHRLFGGSNPDF